MQKKRPTIGLLNEKQFPSFAIDILNGALDATEELNANLICFPGGVLQDSMRRFWWAERNILFDLVDKQNVDALVIMSTTLGAYIGPDALQAFIKRYEPLPIVSIGWALEGIPSVLMDYVQSAYDMVAHLINKHTYRRIACIRVQEGHVSGDQRFQGYRQALQDFALPYDPDLVVAGDLRFESGKRAIATLLDERDVSFDAVAAANDDMALGAIEELQSRGFDVPNDIAVVGHDNRHGGAVNLPSLTTIPQDFYGMAWHATEVALALLAGESVPEKTLLPTQLVVRESCGCTLPIVARVRQKTAFHELQPALSQPKLKRKEEILAQLTAVNVPFISEHLDWAMALLDALLADIAGKKTFLHTLNSLLQETIKADQNVLAWQDVLTIFQHHLILHLKGAERETAVELLHQGRVLISRRGQQVAQLNQHNAYSEARASRLLSDELITTFNIAELMDKTTRGLIEMGLNTCFIALYTNPEQPLAEAKMILAIQNGKRLPIEAAQQNFPTQQLIPADMHDTTQPIKYVVHALHFREKQLGFIIFAANPAHVEQHEALHAELSTALTGALLVQQEEKRTRQLQTVTEVSRTITNILDKDELLQTVVDLTNERFNLYHTHIYLLNENETTLVLQAGVGTIGQAMVAEKWEIPLTAEKSLIAHIARKRKGDYVNNVHKSPYWLAHPLLPKTKAELAVPIHIRGRLLGVLDVQSDSLGHFDDEDVQILSTLAAQIAVALQNSMLVQNLAQQTKEATQANAAKSQFLANMSHELRTPLNAILGYADILTRQNSQNIELTDGLSIIQQSGNHLLTLINDILDLSRIEAGKMELRLTPFHLPTFLVQITNIIRGRAEAKNLALIYEAPPMLPNNVVGDATRLRQVLLNLLGNAIKYTEQGYISLKVSQQTQGQGRARKNTAVLRFMVEDTGVGMSQEEIEKIFNPFEQVGLAQKQAEGAGLGLAISQDIVQLMGGQLQVTSEKSRGSCFWFNLQLQVTNEETPEMAPPQKIIGYQGMPRSILIADDNKFNRDLLREMLEPLGFLVSVAHDGQQVIEQVAVSSPDVILMDQAMPHKSGLEATQTIRTNPNRQDTIIIMVSASVLEQDQQKSLEAGCNDFLSKPVYRTPLLNMLAQHLHLVWVYDDPKPAMDTTNELNVTLPRAEVDELRELLKSRRVWDIREKASTLAKKDKSYQPFAEKLKELTKRFEFKQIESLLDQFVAIEDDLS